MNEAGKTGRTSALLPQHVRIAWHVSRNRWSGGAMLAVAGVAVATGYGLYYTSAALRDWCKWLHLALGLVAFVALPLHIWLGRRRSRTVRG